MAEFDKETLVKVENLSKVFGVGKGLTTRDFASLFKKKTEFKGMGDTDRIVGDNFWALRDINFEVKSGETLGIIGPNGAGKTTLLKILSKILQQTHGTYTLNGRVSSLIGVGTGFHNELTGRENVYFNGALLGMNKAEIDSSFEEIVDFAEVGSFIDTPVKYYSSGMRSRLAFSVAMNLDAEIMIIDEALAVGDASFRAKSTQKMRETAFTGRTVLFVTHSLSFLRDVCERSILIDKGRLVGEGTTDDVVDQYLDTGGGAKKKASYSWKHDPKTHVGDDVLKMTSLTVHKNGKTLKSRAVDSTDELEVHVEFTSKENTGLYSVGYALYDEANRRVWRANVLNAGVTKGKNVFACALPTDVLKPGTYHVALDIEKRGRGEEWVVPPSTTEAKIQLHLATNREDILELKNEGIIKPVFDWKRL